MSKHILFISLKFAYFTSRPCQNSDDSLSWVGEVVKSTIYKNFQNTLRLFDVLPNFPFTTINTKLDYL